MVLFMKKLLGIVVLGLLLNSNAFSKDYSGKKLFCLYKNSLDKLKYNEYSAVEFISNELATIYYISTQESSRWKINQIDYKYIVKPARITFGTFNAVYINRETLELRFSGRSQKCEIKSNDWSIYESLEAILKKIILEQESKNQF